MTSISKPRAQPGRPRTVEAWIDVIAQADTDECIPFPFNRDALGYGLYVATTGRKNRKKKRAHNRVCEITHGPPPSPAHRAIHSCDNPPCCNKRHLRWGTAQDNSDDAVKRGRACRGERHDKAKLDDETVRYIRRQVEQGAQQKALAEALGMARSVVSEVVNRKAWKHVS